MGREVRRVPKDWDHPKATLSNMYVPLLPGEWSRPENQGPEDGPINPAHYMPDWPEDQRTHYMMYEDTSEGTPISPAFETPEELARWLTDTKASRFSSDTAPYETWLMIARGGWVPDMIVTIPRSV